MATAPPFGGSRYPFHPFTRHRPRRRRRDETSVGLPRLGRRLFTETKVAAALSSEVVLRTSSRDHQDILPENKTAPRPRRTVLRPAENSETDPVGVAVRVSTMAAETAEPIYVRDRQGEARDTARVGTDGANRVTDRRHRQGVIRS